MRFNIKYDVNHTIKGAVAYPGGMGGVVRGL